MREQSRPPVWLAARVFWRVDVLIDLSSRIRGKLISRHLAGRAGMGERTFMRRFKKATGETPVGYLQQLRIETARRWLETTSDAVEDITRRSGYEDISSFRKLFKKHTGLSPTAHRKRFSSLP
jgi:transcriptional regulator GlxA family with amidase domain